MSWTDWRGVSSRSLKGRKCSPCQIACCRCLFVALVAEHAGGVTLGPLRARSCRAASNPPFLAVYLPCCLLGPSVLQAARSGCGGALVPHGVFMVSPGVLGFYAAPMVRTATKAVGMTSRMVRPAAAAIFSLAISSRRRT